MQIYNVLLGSWVIGAWAATIALSWIAFRRSKIPGYLILGAALTILPIALNVCIHWAVPRRHEEPIDLAKIKADLPRVMMRDSVFAYAHDLETACAGLGIILVSRGARKPSYVVAAESSEPLLAQIRPLILVGLVILIVDLRSLEWLGPLPFLFLNGVDPIHRFFSSLLGAAFGCLTWWTWKKTNRSGFLLIGAALTVIPGILTFVMNLAFPSFVEPLVQNFEARALVMAGIEVVRLTCLAIGIALLANAEKKSLMIETLR